MKNNLLFIFILFTGILGAQSQHSPVWTKHYTNVGLGGSGVNLRETLTHHNLKLDADGNVYMGVGGVTGYKTYSLMPDGNLRWSKSYTGTSATDDLITCLEVSDSGNCYVSGYTNETARGQIITTIKYDQMGNQKWVVQLTDTLYNSAIANAIILDKDENLYVAGTAYITGYASDIILIKYDKNGNEKWIKRFDRDLKYDRASALALSKNGDQIFLSGTTNKTGSSDDISVLSFNALNGSLQWDYHYDYNTGTNNPDVGVDIETDTMGNVYAAGNSFSSGNDDIVLIKIRGADGSQTWASRLNDTLKGNDGVFDMDVSDFGNIYLGGHTIDGSGGTSFLVLKYNANGFLVWRSAYAGFNGKIDRISDLQLGGPNQDIYVAGSASTGFNQSFESVVVQFDPSTGDTLWIGRGGSATWSTSGMTAGLAVNTNGDVYVDGSSASITLAKFETKSTSRTNFTLLDQISVYPNPSNGQVFINQIRPESNQLKLIDLSGRLIHFDLEKTPNGLRLTTDYRGIAVLHLRNEGKVQSQKLLFNSEL